MDKLTLSLIDLLKGNDIVVTDARLEILKIIISFSDTFSRLDIEPLVSVSQSAITKLLEQMLFRDLIKEVEQVRPPYTRGSLLKKYRVTRKMDEWLRDF